MKKIIASIFLLLAASTTLNSCGNKEKIEAPAPSSPSVAANR